MNQTTDEAPRTKSRTRLWFLSVLAAIVVVFYFFMYVPTVKSVYQFVDAETEEPLVGFSVECHEPAYDPPGITLLRRIPFIARLIKPSQPRVTAYESDDSGKVSFRVRGWNYHLSFPEFPAHSMMRRPPYGRRQATRRGLTGTFYVVRAGSDLEKTIKHVKSVHEDQGSVCGSALRNFVAQLEAEGAQFDDRSSHNPAFGLWQHKLLLLETRDGNEEDICNVVVRGSVKDDWSAVLPILIEHGGNSLDDRFIEFLTTALKERNWEFDIVKRATP